MQRLLTLGVFVFLASVASAQATTGPFTGNKSEDFETQTPGMFTTCLIGRVFNNQGDLCTPGNSGAHVTSGWGFMCTIFPHGGSRFTGSAGGFYEYTFDTPVSRFGGFFGTNSGTPDGVANFFDPGNNLLGTAVITAPADCTWTWNGWIDNGGNGFGRIEIHSNTFGGAFMMMDDMEADFGAPGGPGTPLCFGDGSGAPCGCGNEAPSGSGSGCLNSLGVGATLSASGSASLGSPNLTLTASDIRSQPGLFFQGVNTINGGVGVTFGDGIRCCGGTVIRLSIEQPAGPEPNTTETTLTSTDGSITPGDKRCYQYWYRDPGAGNPCGAGLFNLSNAVTVTWGP